MPTRIYSKGQEAILANSLCKPSKQTKSHFEYIGQYFTKSAFRQSLKTRHFIVSEYQKLIAQFLKTVNSIASSSGNQEIREVANNLQGNFNIEYIVICTLLI